MRVVLINSSRRRADFGTLADSGDGMQFGQEVDGQLVVLGIA